MTNLPDAPPPPPMQEAEEDRDARRAKEEKKRRRAGLMAVITLTAAFAGMLVFGLSGDPAPVEPVTSPTPIVSVSPSPPPLDTTTTARMIVADAVLRNVLNVEAWCNRYDSLTPSAAAEEFYAATPAGPQSVVPGTTVTAQDLFRELVRRCDLR